MFLLLFFVFDDFFKRAELLVKWLNGYVRFMNNIINSSTYYFTVLALCRYEKKLTPIMNVLVILIQKKYVILPQTQWTLCQNYQ
jgi:hypothetical protein